MKRCIVMTAIFALAMFACGGATTGVKGKLIIGGYTGYGIGMGDDFKEFNSVFSFGKITRQLQPGVVFGGKLCYGIGSNFLIGGTVGFQKMKFKDIIETNDPPFSQDNSTTDTWIAINANVAFLFATAGSFSPYIEAGPGMYFDPDDRGAGFAGGIGGVYSVSPSLLLDAGARIHLILGMGELSYVELHGGISVLIGGTN